MTTPRRGKLLSLVSALLDVLLILALGSLILFLMKLNRSQSFKINLSFLVVIVVLIFILIWMSRIIHSLVGIAVLLIVVVVAVLARARK